MSLTAAQTVKASVAQVAMKPLLMAASSLSTDSNSIIESDGGTNEGFMAIP